MTRNPIVFGQVQELKEHPINLSKKNTNLVSLLLANVTLLLISEHSIRSSFFPLLQIDTIGRVVVKLHQFDTIVCKAASPPVVIPTTNIMENQLLKSIANKSPVNIVAKYD